MREANETTSHWWTIHSRLRLLANRRNNYDADEGRELFASEGTCIAGLRHINEQYLCRGANRTTQALAG